MKRVTALVVLALFASPTPVPAQPAPKAVQYEYTFLTLYHGSARADEEQLNRLAAEGWEVVTGTTQSGTGDGSPPSDARLVLKRAKR